MADDPGAPDAPHVEVECDRCLSDFDLAPMDADARWTCPGCGSEHRLGDVGQLCIPAGRDRIWVSNWRLVHGVIAAGEGGDAWSDDG